MPMTDRKVSSSGCRISERTAMDREIILLAVASVAVTESRSGQIIVMMKHRKTIYLGMATVAVNRCRSEEVKRDGKIIL